MGEKRTLLQRAESYVKKHMAAYESWDKGDVKGIWEEKDGTVCISYECGQWFHYKEANGEVTWW